MDVFPSSLDSGAEESGLTGILISRQRSVSCRQTGVDHSGERA